MLFNSYQVIFFFLPIVLIGSCWAGSAKLAPVISPALASLVFYSVSSWWFVLLLLASVALLRRRLAIDLVARRK